MTVEDDIHVLIRLAQEAKEQLPEVQAGGTQATVIALTGWLNGIEDALVLLAREIDQLKSDRMAPDEKD